MAAGVLNSSIAIEMSIFVVRTFVELRKMLGPHERLAAKLNELDRKVARHEQTTARLIDAIRQWIAPPERKSRSIGFTADLRKAKTPQT